MTARTFLLGAGFSKAFDPRLPLMSQLGPHVVDALGLPDDTLAPFGNNVEMWLSYLAERQPWDSEERTLTNRSLFLRASDAVAGCVRDAASDRLDPASAEGQALARFVLEAKMSESPVLTFNYDMLIEEAHHDWDTWATGADLYPLPLVERHPAGESRFLSDNPAREPVLQLYKLHGSLNWLAPVDGSDGPVTLLRSHKQPRPRARHLYSDLRTLIVPPTSTKSSFYGGSAIRALWRAAAERLRETQELVVIGYSFPMSDHQAITMLRTCLPAGARITVVDQNPEVGARVTEEFTGHEVRVVNDAVVYVNDVCGWLLSWQYAPVEGGWNEQLKVAGMLYTRHVPAADLAVGSPVDEVGNQLVKCAPSLLGTWCETGRAENGHPIYGAYLPRMEWTLLANNLDRFGWSQVTNPASPVA